MGPLVSHRGCLGLLQGGEIDDLCQGVLLELDEVDGLVVRGQGVKATADFGLCP